jgi:hypothetical protein
LIILFGLLAIDGMAQKLKTIPIKDVCETVKIAYTSVEPVVEFKSNLTMKLKIGIVTNGLKDKSVSIDISEEISDESAIYQIDEKVAISLSVGRVIENRNKFYLYKIHLFRKINGCWEDSSIQSTWSKFNLGVVTGGYAYGSQGTSSYLGFSGTVSIE